MSKLLSIFTVLAGLALAVSPWVFRFTADRVAATDVRVGGLVVAFLGAWLLWVLTTMPDERPEHRLPSTGR